jgi:hypothetical protein
VEHSLETKRSPERPGHGSLKTAEHTQTPAHPMLELQQQAGNQAVQELLRAGSI